MNRREQLILRLTESLTEPLEAEIEKAKGSPGSGEFLSKYEDLKRSLDAIKTLYAEFRSESTTKVYYQYMPVNMKGLEIFREKYGELLSFMDAYFRLKGYASDSHLRNMLHSSDYFTALRARTKLSCSFYITKESVDRFKERLVQGEGSVLLEPYRRPAKKEDRVVKNIITLDPELSETLKPYLLD